MYKKYIALCALVFIGSTNANAQMFTDIKTPSESLYELTEPSNKVIKNIKLNLKELITLRLQSPEVGAGEKEINFFKSDIQKIYSNMDEEVHRFWKNNKKGIMGVYADNLTPEELIVYNKYLSSTESKVIEKKRPKINHEVSLLMQKWVEKKLDKHIEELTEKIIQRQLNVNE